MLSSVLPSVASMNSLRICVISPHWEWPIIKVLRLLLHVIALTISRVRCFLTAGCAVTCAHQAFLCLLGCLLSTLMAIGGWVQASPDHCSKAGSLEPTGGTEITLTQPEPKEKPTYSCTYILNKNRRISLFSAACVSSAHCCLLVFHEGRLPPTPPSRGQSTGTLRGHYWDEDTKPPVGNGRTWHLQTANNNIVIVRG